jgi:hypothetical protein
VGSFEVWLRNASTEKRKTLHQVRSDKIQIFGIGGRCRKIQVPIPLIRAVVDDKNKPMVPVLDPTFLRAPRVAGIVDPRSDFVRLELINGDRHKADKFRVTRFSSNLKDPRRSNSPNSPG